MDKDYLNERFEYLEGELYWKKHIGRYATEEAAKQAYIVFVEI